MSDLARALLDELEPEDLATLAERLSPFLRAPTRRDDEWLSTKQTAEYLGLTVHAVHHYISEGRLPFHQERPGARCYFRRSELDAWRA